MTNYNCNCIHIKTCIPQTIVLLTLQLLSLKLQIAHHFGNKPSFFADTKNLNGLKIESLWKYNKETTTTKDGVKH